MILIKERSNFSSALQELLIELGTYRVESSRHNQEKCSKNHSNNKYAIYKNTRGNDYFYWSVQLSSVQSLSSVRLFATQWITARQASLSITNSWSLPRLMSIELVMPSSHLILCHPLLLLPPIPPSIRVFSNESTLRMRWPEHWSFSFSIIPSKEHPGLISFRMDWLDLLAIHKVFTEKAEAELDFEEQVRFQKGSTTDEKEEPADFSKDLNEEL